LRLAIEATLQEFLGDPGLGYVFIDKGTFGKQLRFVDDQSGPWCLGVRSSSTILYGFVRWSAKASNRACLHALEALLKHLGVPNSSVLRTHIGPGHNFPDAQQSLNLAAS
jgi:hypothetical protein